MFSGPNSPRSRRGSPVFLSNFPVFALAALLLLSVGAVPAADRVAAGKPETGKHLKLDDGVYRPLQGAQESIDRLRSRLAGPLQQKERARLNRQLAGILLGKADMETELGNHAYAIADLEAALETGALADAEMAATYLHLAHLYVLRNPPDEDKAVKYYRKYKALAGASDTEGKK